MGRRRNPARPSLMVVGVFLLWGLALLMGMDFKPSTSAGPTLTDGGILVEDIFPQSFALTPTVTIYFPLLVKNHPSFKVPNDAYYASHQWNLLQINAHRAWTITTGNEDIIIAIVDTGVDLDHPDLQGKIVPGCNFVNKDSAPSDNHGHGSHVAGIAAAVTDNGLGVAGVSWGGKIMPIKVLRGDGGGSDYDTAEGMIWAVDHGAKIINLSLGSEDPCLALRDAANYVREQGGLVFAAAGNCGVGGYDCSSINPIIYPAAYSGAIAVGATTRKDGHASFSEHHPYVDVAAPGVSVYSTHWDDSYVYYSGTSQATPHVTGLAALIWSVNPDLSNDQVRNIIEATAIDLGNPGKDDFFGYGRIDAYAAVLRAFSASFAPAERPVEHMPIEAKLNPSGEFVAGTILVKPKPGVTGNTAQSFLEGLSASISSQIPEIGVLRLSVPVGCELEAIADLEKNPLVEYAEPDYIVHVLD